MLEINAFFAFFEVKQTSGILSTAMLKPFAILLLSIISSGFMFDILPSRNEHREDGILAIFADSAELANP